MVHKSKEGSRRKHLRGEVYQKQSLKIKTVTLSVGQWSFLLTAELVSNTTVPCVGAPGDT